MLVDKLETLTMFQHVCTSVRCISCTKAMQFPTMKFYSETEKFQKNKTRMYES